MASAILGTISMYFLASFLLTEYLISGAELSKRGEARRGEKAGRAYQVRPRDLGFAPLCTIFVAAALTASLMVCRMALTIVWPNMMITTRPAFTTDLSMPPREAGVMLIMLDTPQLRGADGSASGERTRPACGRRANGRCY